MRDEDIDLSDIPEATEEEMAGGVLRFEGKPVPENMVLVPLESDLVERFKERAHGDGYASLINSALRAALSV